MRLVWAAVFAAALLAGCSSSHRATGPTAAPVPAGYTPAQTVTGGGITVGVDGGPPYAMPAGHTTSDYPGAVVVWGPQHAGPYLWYRGQLIALQVVPLCAVIGNVPGCIGPPLPTATTAPSVTVPGYASTPVPYTLPGYPAGSTAASSP